MDHVQLCPIIIGTQQAAHFNQILREIMDPVPSYLCQYLNKINTFTYNLNYLYYGFR